MEQQPVLLVRSRDADLEIPADLREKIHVQYGSLNDSPIEIEVAIRAAIERDGRPSHLGVELLLAARSRRYLSRRLLQNLQYSRLQTGQIDGLMRAFKSVEELLAAPRASIARAAGVPEYGVVALEGELREI